MTRVLVCGGQHYADHIRAYEALDAIHNATAITLIIHGAATGADTIAATWAAERRVPVDPYPAHWDDIGHVNCVLRVNRRGKPYNALAGFQRNTRMLMEASPELVVALPGGNGTADMVRKALKADVPVVEVER